MADYDVVVIGSGAGGLTAAVGLANVGMKVLVLEQHYMAGGWCHSFVLDGHRYSPGVHYLGEMEEGGLFRTYLEGLGIAGDLELCQLNEDGYDHILVAGEKFDVPVGRQRLEDRLIGRFPNEVTGIRKFLKLMGDVSSDLHKIPDYEGARGALLPLAAPNLVFKGLLPLGVYLNRWIKSPILRTILTAQCGDYGLPASTATTALHAGIMGHYFDGGYYPRGGAHRIPRAYVRQLKRKGGELRLSTEVTRILVEHGAAVGVELANGERISAKYVVSNADPEMTYNKLIDPELLSRSLKRKLRRTDYSIASLGLFLATDLDLKAMGYDSGNYWYYPNADTDSVYDAKNMARLDRDEFDSAFLTITTLKDPSKRTKGVHTVEVFTFLPHNAFAQWDNTPVDDRPESYIRYKAELTQKLLRSADRIVPGLSESLVFEDVGTPVTNYHYCRSFRGNVYGTAKTLRQIGPFAYQTRSEIKGLFLCGASTISHGVLGVVASGLVAARQVARCSQDEFLREGANGKLTIYPSERPEEWIGDLKRRRNSRSAAAAAA